MDSWKSSNPRGNKGSEPVLKWTDPRGVTRTLSLAKFANGTEVSRRQRFAHRGRAQLTAEILPALAHRSHDLSLGSVRDHVQRLSRFFHFLDLCETGALAGGEPPASDSGGETGELRIDGLSDLPQHVWLLYAAHLKHSGLACETASGYFTLAREIIEEACRIGGFGKPDYYEPVFGHGSEGAPARLRADLDHPALKHILKSCRRLLKDRQNAPLLRLLAHVRLGPDSPRSDADLETCEGALMHVYTATLNALTGGGRIDHRAFDGKRTEYRKRLAESGISDQGIADYRSVVGPDKLEVMAAAILIMARTGWTDALHNLDIAGPWQVAQTEPDLGRALYLIRSVRPKTGRVQTFLCNDGYWSPLSIIRRLIDRTAVVRRMAAMHCEILKSRIAEGKAGDGDALELERLEAVARSPFAYFIPRQKGTRCLRRLFEDGMTGYRKALASLVGYPSLSAAPEVISRAAGIRLSDFRHASAVRVLNSTGSMSAVQAHLAHQSPATTESYVSQPQVRLKAFEDFARLMGFVMDEAAEGRVIDLRILRLRMLSEHTGELDPGMRLLLEESGGAERGPGICCADPHDAPTTGRQAKACPFDLCVICRNGIIVPSASGAFEALAGWFGRMTYEIERMSHGSVEGSTEEFQRQALAGIRDAHYPKRTEEFDRLAEARRMELVMREADDD